jgi:Fe-S-cluster-containing dehydrogenase component
MESIEVGKYPNAKRIFMPMQCMHCSDPPCVSVCPTKASQQREDGIIFVDDEKCIGCRYCMIACPYGSRFYDANGKGYYDELTPFEEVGYRRHPVGTVGKCDFCRNRIDAGLAKGLKPGIDMDATPQCVATCPPTARYFGDLDDPSSTVCKLVASGRAIQLQPELGTDPGLYYLPP